MVAFGRLRVIRTAPTPITATAAIPTTSISGNGAIILNFAAWLVALLWFESPVQLAVTPHSPLPSGL